MAAPVIHRASGAEYDTLHKLGRQTFLEAFADQNTPEDIHHYVDRAFAKDQIKEELTNPESEFYLARSENQNIGYLKVNYGQAQTEHHDMLAVEIESIYVLEAYYGKRVGKLLFNQAFEVATTRKATCLWLGVWEKNLRAIQFYNKLGFMAFGKHSFLLGSDLQTDILMRLEMTPFSFIH
ncbi:MAG: GNAT family N-acetyltransferase [Reichenbachiella sp.]|uniref:GNAT family N-acetyltransferase n=1 Tax=Reichenbachiella sp. TaxID=2184521 RepID=UPI0032635995